VSRRVTVSILEVSDLACFRVPVAKQAGYLPLIIWPRWFVPSANSAVRDVPRSAAVDVVSSLRLMRRARRSTILGALP